MMEFLDIHYQAVLFMLIGIAAFCYGMLKKYQKAYLLKNGIKAFGIIVDYELDKNLSKDNISPIYYPIVEFEDSKGILHRLKYEYGQNSKMFSKNPQVEIYYDGNDVKKFIMIRGLNYLTIYFRWPA